LKHINDGKKCTVNNLVNAFPEYKPQDLSNILQELKRKGKVQFIGSRRAGYWGVKNKKK